MKTEFYPFPELETERLMLRKLTVKDANDVYEIRSNPDMLDYTDGKVDEYIDDTVNYINIVNRGIDNSKWINWAIVNKANNRVIGNINIWNLDRKEKKAEIGYGLNPIYQGKGLMKEALKAVVEYGFKKMHLSMLEVWTERRNIRSIKLVESFGFKFLKEVQDKGYYKKQIFNMKVYVLRKDQI